MSEDARGTPASIRRVRRFVAAAALAALAFSQDPGKVVGDTKIDLVLSPGAFLGRALSAWDPHASFGQLQNQAYGYLFPMGPFFLLGHLLSVPAWVVQRAWWSVLLVLAFAGMLRVTRLLDAGGEGSRLLAAFAYALSPRVLTVLGGISVEALPLAVLPWVLAPLIRGADVGSPRRAAMRSAVAVACIGGVNAAATLAVLPLPLLYLVTRQRGPRRASLIRWWLIGVALATLWWVLPLFVLGRYAFPFLDYIENASITTSVDSLTNVVRGASHWLAFLPLHGHPFWRAGWELGTASLQILATGVLAAAGLAGLTSARLRERRFLLLGVLLGVLAISIGHAGAFTSPLGAEARHLLDGPLAAFRNVHKFDPMLRLPLAVGLCYLPSLVPARVQGWRYSRPVLGSLGVLVVVIAAAPALQGRLAPDGGFTSVPDYWRQAASYVDDHAGRERSLLVPPSNFAEYTWGRPMDEPLGALASSPWAVRNAVPLGAPGATRLLDAIDQRMISGAGSPGLAAAVARAGVSYVVLRNDVDPSRSGAPAPELFRSALTRSPGFRLVAGFGPRLGGSREHPLRSVEIFHVEPPAPEVVVYPVSATQVLSGGPEATLPLADLGLLGPTVAAADARDLNGDPVIVTDTLRRRSINFGGDPGSNYSPTLARATDPDRGRPAGDVLPYAGVQHQTVVDLTGARSVTASSSAADPFAAGYRGPQFRPASAVDGDPDTAWVSGWGTVGQWLEIDLGRPFAAGYAVVRMVVDESVGPPVTEIEVRTDSGVRRDQVRPTDAAQPLALPPGPTRSVRLTVRKVQGSTAGAVGIAGLDLPGITIRETVVPPADGTARVDAGAPAAYVFNRPDGYRGDCYLAPTGWACMPGLAESGEEVAALDRTFDLPRAAADLSVTVRPRAGAALDRLLDTSLGFRASASSTLVDDPAARPGAAFDGDPATAWLSAPGDVNPQLVIELPRATTVRELRLSGADSDLKRIRRVVLRVDGKSRVESYRPGRVLRFPAMTGRRLSIGFGLAGGSDAAAPLRLAEVSFDGVAARAGARVEVPCGAGPAIALDGRVHRARVSVDGGRLLDLSPVPAALCDGPVSLSGTRHRLIGGATAAFEVSGVALGDRAVLHPESQAGRDVEVRRWASEHRSLIVAAGPAGYLTLAEGANAGWQARLDGRALQPVRIDGWRQGWLLPASAHPVHVELTFAPGRWHRAGLAAGAVALVALLLALALPGRTGEDLPSVVRREAVAEQPGAAPRWGRVVATVLLMSALAVALVGPWGLALLLAAAAVPPRWRWVAAGAGVTAGAVASVVTGSTLGAASQLLCAWALLVSAMGLADASTSTALARGLRWLRSRSGRSTRRHEAAATSTVNAPVSTATPTK